MELSSVTLIDGTVFKLDDYRYGGMVKQILYAESIREVLIQITKRETPLHIPYHSVLFYLEKE